MIRLTNAMRGMLVLGLAGSAFLTGGCATTPIQSGSKFEVTATSAGRVVVAGESVHANQVGSQLKKIGIRYSTVIVVVKPKTLSPLQRDTISKSLASAGYRTHTFRGPTEATATVSTIGQPHSARPVTSTTPTRTPPKSTAAAQPSKATPSSAATRAKTVTAPKPALSTAKTSANAVSKTVSPASKTSTSTAKPATGSATNRTSTIRQPASTNLTSAARLKTRSATNAPAALPPSVSIPE